MQLIEDQLFKFNSYYITVSVVSWLLNWTTKGTAIALIFVLCSEYVTSEDTHYFIIEIEHTVTITIIFIRDLLPTYGIVYMKYAYHWVYAVFGVPLWYSVIMSMVFTLKRDSESFALSPTDFLRYWIFPWYWSTTCTVLIPYFIIWEQSPQGVIIISSVVITDVWTCTWLHACDMHAYNVMHVQAVLCIWFIEGSTKSSSISLAYIISFLHVHYGKLMQWIMQALHRSWFNYDIMAACVSQLCIIIYYHSVI